MMKIRLLLKIMCIAAAAALLLCGCNKNEDPGTETPAPDEKPVSYAESADSMMGLKNMLCRDTALAAGQNDGLSYAVVDLFNVLYCDGMINMTKTFFDEKSAKNVLEDRGCTDIKYSAEKGSAKIECVDKDDTYIIYGLDFDGEKESGRLTATYDGNQRYLAEWRHFSGFYDFQYWEKAIYGQGTAYSYVRARLYDEGGGIIACSHDMFNPPFTIYAAEEPFPEGFEKAIQSRFTYTGGVLTAYYGMKEYTIDTNK